MVDVNFERSLEEGRFTKPNKCKQGGRGRGVQILVIL